MDNIIINNRFFNNSIKNFFLNKKNKLQSSNIYCDIDTLSQYPNYKNCTIINHIKNYNIFGDKYTHYNLLIKNNSNSKYLMETHLFKDSKQIKGIIDKYPIWIIKPRNDYGRHGVTIVRNIEEINIWLDKHKKQEWILQKYMIDPMLIDKKKFHIRIYVTIKKENNNLLFYVYKKGIIYTATNNYDINSDDNKSHLSGADKKNNIYVLERKHVLYKKIWHSVKDLVDKCVVPMTPYIKCPNLNNVCYKLLALDVLIDNKFNLYLAEINSRLISFKYPPKNFKDELYTELLNSIYFNKYNMMELVSSNRIDTFKNFEIYKLPKKLKIILIILVVTVCVLIIKLLFTKIYS